MDQRYIYVAGGRDSINETPLDTVERLDAVQPVENQKWESLQIVIKDGGWSPRDTLGSFALNDSEILLFGGEYGWISDCYILQTKNNNEIFIGTFRLALFRGCCEQVWRQVLVEHSRLSYR